MKKARQSADKAIELNPKNSAGYQVRGEANLWENKLDMAEQDSDSAIGLDPSNARGYILKSETLLAKLAVRIAAGRKIREEIDLLKRATEVLESGNDKTKGSPHFDRLQRERDSVSSFYEHFSRNATPSEPPSTDVVAEPNVTPLRILSKRSAAYTDAARSANIEGVIRVAAIFAASGKIEYVLFLKRLGYGLEQNVLAAVKDIKFEPRRVDGKPVSTVKIIEYSFDIY
ncbi:MAG TPA: energy transducer TonB [Pyrinomonadaceae bacterium]